MCSANTHHLSAREKNEPTNERNKYSSMGNSQLNSNRQCGHIREKKRLNGFNYISPYIQPLTISTNAYKAAKKLQISERTDSGAGKKERMRMETNTFFSLQKKESSCTFSKCWVLVICLVTLNLLFIFFLISFVILVAVFIFFSHSILYAYDFIYLVCFHGVA